MLVVCSAALAVSFARTFTITEFPVPTVRPSPTGISSAADESLWFTDGIGQKPFGITLRSPTVLYFTEQAGNHMGKIGF